MHRCRAPSFRLPLPYRLPTFSVRPGRANAVVLVDLPLTSEKPGWSCGGKDKGCRTDEDADDTDYRRQFESGIGHADAIVDPLLLLLRRDDGCRIDISLAFDNRVGVHAYRER